MAIYGEDGKALTEADLISKGKGPTPAEEPGWFEPGSKSEAALRGFSQGATIGLGKYIQAPINAIGADDKKSYWQNIKDSVAGEDAANKASADANPLSYGAGNLVGSAPSVLAAGAGSIPATMAKNALVSGVQSAADNPNDALASGLGGVALGAGTSGALGLGGKALKAVANKVTPALGEAELLSTVKSLTSPSGPTGAAKTALRSKAGNGGVMQGSSLLQSGVDEGVPEMVKKPAFSAVKDYLAGTEAPSVMGSAVQGAKEGLKNSAKNAGLATVVGGSVGSIPGALASGATVAGVQSAANAAKKGIGIAAAKDIANGGTGELVGDMAKTSQAAQAGAAKIRDAMGDGGNFASITGFLNQTDPESRAALNPDNPLNDEKQR